MVGPRFSSGLCPRLERPSLLLLSVPSHSSLLGSARIPTLKEEERVGENLQEDEDEEDKTFYASEILQTEKGYCYSRARKQGI